VFKLDLSIYIISLQQHEKGFCKSMFEFYLVNVYVELYRHRPPYSFMVWCLINRRKNITLVGRVAQSV